jgi:hypothetical protein
MHHLHCIAARDCDAPAQGDGSGQRLRWHAAKVGHWCWPAVDVDRARCGGQPAQIASSGPQHCIVAKVAAHKWAWQGLLGLQQAAADLRHVQFSAVDPAESEPQQLVVVPWW